MPSTVTSGPASSAFDARVGAGPVAQAAIIVVLTRGHDRGAPRRRCRPGGGRPRPARGRGLHRRFGLRARAHSRSHVRPRAGEPSASRSPTGTLAIGKVEDLVPLLAFAIAVFACSVPATRHDVRPLGAVLAVGGGVGAPRREPTPTSWSRALCLLGVVVVTAVMGVAVRDDGRRRVVPRARTTGSRRRSESLEITKVQDLVPLVAFTLAAATSAATVARVRLVAPTRAADHRAASVRRSRRVRRRATTAPCSWRR